MPALSGQASYGFTARVFGYLGDTPDEILVTVLLHPEIPLRMALQPDHLIALAAFWGPTLGLFLVGWDVALLMTPFLAYQLLSANPAMGRLEDWYPSITMVILFWATNVGLGRLRDPTPRHLRGYRTTAFTQDAQGGVWKLRVA